MAKAKDASVAPKERVNIVYKSQTGDASEEVELPLKLLMLGDFSGAPNEDMVEERDVVNINKDNFDDVVKSYNISVNTSVKNTLGDKEGEDLAVDLKIQSMKDFSPDNIAQQVPELNALLELRQALLALKGPLGNVPAFRKTIQEILANDESRQSIIADLGLEEG